MIHRRFILLLAFTVRLAAAPGDEYWDDRFDALGLDGGVRYMAAHGDEVYVIGEFTMAGNVAATGVAKWDGTRWSALGGEPPPLYRIYQMAANDMGVFITGSFTNSTGTNTLLNWNANGWRAVDTGPLQAAFGLASQDGRLYVGSAYGSTNPALSTLATWDGKIWSPLPAGLTNPVTAIAFSNGVVFAMTYPTSVAALENGRWSSQLPPTTSFLRLLAANDLGLFAAASAGGGELWKLDGDGWIETRDCSCGCDPPPCDWLFALVGTHGALFAGGSLLTPQFQYVLKWDGSNWTTLGTGINAWVQALASNGSELFVGGAFTTAGGKPSRRFGIWHIPRTLKVRSQRDELVISWPKADTNLTLEVTAKLRDGDWVEVNETPVIVANRLTITNNTTQGSRFFRLRQR